MVTGTPSRPPVYDGGRNHDDRRDDRRGNDGDRDGDHREGWRRDHDGRWQQHGNSGSNWNGGNWNNGNWNNGRNDNNHAWDNRWRSDRRYSWQDHRNQYRSLYRAPRYSNPYGYSYGYQRFGIGIQLGSRYFGSNYWLNDPWQYRLPAAYEPYRWVRYYDDVMLIDLRTGRVVDVIYDFFW
jgi:hypothetical protein